MPLALVLFLNAWVVLIASQTGSTQPKVISLPHGEVSHIPSPDGKWTLIFECPNNCSERKLWIEETSKHSRKLVKEYGRSLDISWAPAASAVGGKPGEPSNGVRGSSARPPPPAVSAITARRQT